MKGDWTQDPGANQGLYHFRIHRLLFLILTVLWCLITAYMDVTGARQLVIVARALLGDEVGYRND